MRSAPHFEFDAATHVYSVDGRAVPSVTQVLEGVGISDYSAVPPDRLAYAQALGTAVHSATELHDTGELDFSSVEGTVVEPYLQQWLDFCCRANFKPRLVEHRGISAIGAMRYGFTVDRTGLLAGVPVVLDIKTGAPSRSWPLQLAAYEDALFRGDGRHRKRYVVRLGSDSWNLPDCFTSPSDLSVFSAALAVETYKQNNP